MSRIGRTTTRSSAIGLVAAAVLVVGASVVVATDRFSDVPNGAYYHNAVTWLDDNNITAGCGGGKYCPNSAVTRGQMAVFLKNLSDSVVQTSSAAFRLFNNGACQDGGGPTVAVSVGPSGLVAVYAEALLSPGDGTEMWAQLYEPTDYPSCENILRSTVFPAERRRTLPGSTVGTLARGGWLIFKATPGRRTFSLRYNAAGHAGGAFPHANERILAVMPL